MCVCINSTRTNKSLTHDADIRIYITYAHPVSRADSVWRTDKQLFFCDINFPTDSLFNHSVVFNLYYFSSPISNKIGKNKIIRMPQIKVKAFMVNNFKLTFTYFVSKSSTMDLFRYIFPFFESKLYYIWRLSLMKYISLSSRQKFCIGFRSWFIAGQLKIDRVFELVLHQYT